MDAMKTDKKQIIRRAIEAWNNHDIRPLLELYGEKWVLHSLFFNPVDFSTGAKIDNSGRVYTQENLMTEWEIAWEAFPEQHREADMILETVDGKVVSVVTISRVRKSGRPVTYNEISIDRISEGKIVETWSMFDRLGYWQQFGLVPQTPELLSQLNKM